LKSKELTFDGIKLSESLTTADKTVPDGSHIIDPEKAEAAFEAEEAHEDHVYLDVCFMLFLMLIVGGIMKEFSAFLGLPYTSLITIIGLGLGIIAELYPNDLGRVGVAI
jgi:hypothetical protein